MVVLRGAKRSFFFHSSQFFGPFHLNFLPLSDLLSFSSFRFLLFRSKGSLENFRFENLDEKKKKTHVLLPFQSI